MGLLSNLNQSMKAYVDNLAELEPMVRAYCTGTEQSLSVISLDEIFQELKEYFNTEPFYVDFEGVTLSKEDFICGGYEHESLKIPAEFIQAYEDGTTEEYFSRFRLDVEAKARKEARRKEIGGEIQRLQVKIDARKILGMENEFETKELIDRVQSLKEEFKGL